MRSLLREAERQDAPFLMLGDLNCVPEQIGCLSDALHGGFIYDVAAMSIFTGKSEPLTTCFAHGSNAGTRRDFAFASRHLL